MSQRRGTVVWAGLAMAGLLPGVFLAGLARAAEPEPADPHIRAQIAAGEFAPALAEARRATTRETRDFWLAQIAAAQAQAGIRGASLATASQISDDLLRTRYLSDIAAEPHGGRGGGPQADFESLIDLITSTIRPTSWDLVGGPGSIAPFPTGVHVDADGVLRPLLKTEDSGRLADLRNANRPQAGQPRESVRRGSPLRMVSLPRLEKQVQLLWAAGRAPTEAMQVLAGLQRIQYVFVFPDSGDLVLAGPAEDWTVGPEDLIVGVESGQPVVRLDDLVVLLRHAMSGPDAKFGCMINPTQEGLTRLQEFLRQSNARPIHADFREGWVRRLRSQLGKQDIEVYGLDPRTRAARVMVEADYRMKLVGMGLEEGVPGVESYLQLIHLAPGQSPPPMGVLRWWFTLNYDAVLASPDRQAFAIRGQGVKVLSESERLTAEGKRVHTGESEPLNRQFVHSFTAHFQELCEKYPIYAELRNLFDLALVGALLRQEGLAEKTAWHMTCFGEGGAFRVELGEAPKAVESVVNHRVIHRTTIVAGVSGGVSAAPGALVAPQAVQTDRSRTLHHQRQGVVPKELPADAWWWD